MPYYVPKNKLRVVENPRFRNSSWENWGFEGLLTGIPLVIIGISISICEIVRIIYGVTNRGIHNYNNRGNAEYTITHDSLLWKVDETNFPIRVEKFHYMPWSYAANLFGLVGIFAGVVGVVSYFRRSYSSLFLFMSLSLLTWLLSCYLIAYYSILLNYYLSYRWDLRENRSQTMDTSYGLIAANLAQSCLLLILGFTGFILGAYGIRAFQSKGLHLEEEYVPYAEDPGLKGN